MADNTREPDRFSLRRLRQACSDCSVHELCLPLGLAPETVSRVFRRFQDDGLIQVDRREVRLLEPERLAAA